jgi:type IV pilus assembly protein PilC
MTTEWFQQTKTLPPTSDGAGPARRSTPSRRPAPGEGRRQRPQKMGGLRIRPHHVPLKDLSWVASKLAAAAATGISLPRVMEIAAAQKPNSVIARVMRDCAARVNAGQSLADAFGAHERELGSVTVAMVRAGEQSGTLDQALFKLSQIFDQRQELRQALATSISYPLLEFVLVVLAALAAIIWIVPKFEGFYQQLGGHLPGLTQMVLNISNFLRHNWWFLPLLIMALGVAWAQARAHHSSRLLMDQTALRIPVIGRVLRASALAQLASTLATLLGSGLPIREALQLARDTTWNQQYKDILDRITPLVTQQGVPLSRAIMDEKLDQELALTIQTGEDAGDMTDILERFSQANLRWANNMAKSLAGTLQPLSVVLLGILVGFLALALYMPELDLIKLI